MYSAETIGVDGIGRLDHDRLVGFEDGDVCDPLALAAFRPGEEVVVYSRYDCCIIPHVETLQAAINVVGKAHPLCVSEVVHHVAGAAQRHDVIKALDAGVGIG